jgi:hypothetical protein
VRIVVEVSCHVVGSERRRYDAPHYHILLEGFIEERIREGRSDGGIELELKLVRNQTQGLSRIFYLSIYSFIFLPSFHPSFLHFSLSFFFIHSILLFFCHSFFPSIFPPSYVRCFIQAVYSPLSNPQIK